MTAVIGAAGGNPDTITTALIALGGAIVGGLLTSGTQLLIHSLQSKRQAAERARRLKSATRIMAADIAYGWVNIEFAVNAQNWGAAPGLRVGLSDDDRRLVMGELSSKGLDDIITADAAVAYWSSMRDRDLAAGNSTPTVKRDGFELAASHIRKAVATLRELAGDPPVVTPEPGGESPTSP